MQSLTFRYSLTQFTYWAASTGAASFATTFLLKAGASSGFVGTLLAMGGLLSCILQPVIAGICNQKGSARLPQILAGMSLACAGCFAVLLIPGVSVTGLGLCYVAGILLSSIMQPLLNGLCISCEQAGYRINFGIARGIGSAASALASLVLGYVIARLGSQWMLLLLISFRALNILVLLGYPALKGEAADLPCAKSTANVHAFLLHYPWYCATLLGILFLGMYHAMTETYMIAILEPLGGNSRHVGTALFLSSMAGAPVIFCSRHIRSRLSDDSLLKIAACSFLLKSILLCFAKNNPTVYCIQLLQMTSYALMEPALVYYAQGSVAVADMLTGQAFSTAAYALGCSAGNFAGGQLLTRGMNAFFIAGIAMALIGVVLIFCTVAKKDGAIGEKAT